MTVITAEYFVGRKKFSGASCPERNETAGAHCIAVSDLDLYKSYGPYQAKREYNPHLLQSLAEIVEYLKENKD